MASIRDYRPGDEAAACYICMKTGDRGGDGEPFYRDDQDALGRIYVVPYLKFSPELALMLVDDADVCGYALATVDSREFYEKYENEWRPTIAQQFPAPSGDESTWTRLDSVYHAYHHPSYFCPEPYDSYPSHLHIDLLERVQRQGYGKKLMSQLIERLRQYGSPGVHLGLGATNIRAYRFYIALGFQELIRRDDGIYMGLRLH